MVALILFAGLLLFAFIYIWCGQVRAVDLLVTDPNDTYECIDYEQQGRQIAPYLGWGDGEALHLPLQVTVQYRSSYVGRKFCSDEAYIALHINEKPAFIDSISIRRPDGTFVPEEFEAGCYLSSGEVGMKVDVALTFYRVSLSLIEAPRLVELELSVHILGKRLFFFPARFPSKTSFKKSFTLFTGPSLGDLWLAIDPGTTATCIATGIALDHIVLSPAENNSKEEGIIPSFLSIDKRYEYQQNETLETLSKRENIMRVGAYAKNIKDAPDLESSNFITFQSIKKLLGYRDEKIIQFKNGAKLILNGNKLTNLLVRGLLRNFKKHLEADQVQYSNFLNENKQYNPKRAVIAIPNNFTASKIQDIVNCFKDLNQFHEIRCIRESEAVLCYYVYQHRALHSSKHPLKDETILIFDMGGATINLSVADAFYKEIGKRKKYFIEIDGQLGYGIGGDTIDYCLARVLFEATAEYPEMSKFNPFDDSGKLKYKDSERYNKAKQKVKDVAEELKHILVRESGNRTRTYLLATYEIESVIKKYFGIDIDINIEGGFYQNFKRTETGIKLIEHSLFVKYLIAPIEDAIEDIAKLSDLSILDTVIFSGRSTLFPGIKELVRQKVKKLVSASRKLEFISLDPDELKTSVVKGACIYAVSRNAISLSQSRASCHFGIRHTHSLDNGSFDFLTIIPFGKQLTGHKIAGKIAMEGSRFDYDNQKVDFFQVMGANPKEILQNGEKHKYAKLGTIDVHGGGPVEYVGMELLFDDTVKGFVLDTFSNDVRPGYRLNTAQMDQEIADANEEHYTWIVN